MMSIRILLVDDHKMMLDGLRTLLEGELDATVVGEASTGREALELTQKTSPDLVIMDIGLRDLNGIDATRQIKKDYPDVRVIALSTYTDKQFVLEMLDAGALGYVVKAAAGEELVRAAKVVMAGKTYLNPDVAGAVVGSHLHPDDDSETTAWSILSHREREILQLLAEGKSSKEIAETLFISVKTVEAHRRNIMDTLDIRGIAELTKYAVRIGLVSLEC